MKHLPSLEKRSIVPCREIDMDAYLERSATVTERGMQILARLAQEREERKRQVVQTIPEIEQLDSAQ